MYLLLLFRPGIKWLHHGMVGMMLHHVIILMEGSEVQVFGDKECQNLLLVYFTHRQQRMLLLLMQMMQ